MNNPFDKTFFKFILGFTIILSFSFAILFFVGKYSSNIDAKDLSAAQKGP